MNLRSMINIANGIEHDIEMTDEFGPGKRYDYLNKMVLFQVEELRHQN